MTQSACAPNNLIAGLSADEIAEQFPEGKLTMSIDCIKEQMETLFTDMGCDMDYVHKGASASAETAESGTGTGSRGGGTGHGGTGMHAAMAGRWLCNSLVGHYDDFLGYINAPANEKMFWGMYFA